MKNQFLSIFLNFPFKITFIFFSFFSFFWTLSTNSEETKTIHRLPIQKIKTIYQSNNNKLLPMPIADLDSASSKVNVNRNPFHKPLTSEISNIDDLYINIQFKGIAKSGDEVVAIIETENSQKFFKKGDDLENGFFVKSISAEDTSVEISNGSRNYKLSFIDLKNSL
jgi:hypothetical protein